MEFYEAPPGHHSFHQDPRWDPKGQPEGRQLKMSDRLGMANHVVIEFYEIPSRQHFFYQAP